MNFFAFDITWLWLYFVATVPLSLLALFGVRKLKSKQNEASSAATGIVAKASLELPKTGRMEV